MISLLPYYLENDFIYSGWILQHAYNWINTNYQYHEIKFHMVTKAYQLFLKFSMYWGIVREYGGKGHVQKVVYHLMEENYKQDIEFFWTIIIIKAF